MRAAPVPILYSECRSTSPGLSWTPAPDMAVPLVDSIKAML